MNTIQVHMILRAKKRLLAHQKRKKKHGMGMFISINEVKVLHFNLQMRVSSKGNDHHSDKINTGVIQF